MTQTSGTLRSGTESTGLVRTPQMYNLEISEAAAPLLAAVIEFMRDEIEPVTDEYHRLGEGRADRWSYGEGQLELLDGLKTKAKEQGLWNFFLPDAETGEGLSNLDYAYIAFELGKNPIASECLNCSAPDTGNMEVLERVGTPEQRGLAHAAVGWRDPVMLWYDRTSGCFFGRKEHCDPSGARRR